LLILAFASDLFLASGFGMTGARNASQVNSTAPLLQKGAGLAPSQNVNEFFTPEAPGLADSLSQTPQGTPDPTATVAVAQPSMGAPLRSLGTQMPAPTHDFSIAGGCDTGSCPTATQPPYSIASQGTPSGLGAGKPSTDETEQASTAMTNAPLGMGGTELSVPTGTPAPEASNTSEPTVPAGPAAFSRIAPSPQADTQQGIAPLIAQASEPTTPAYPASPSTPFDEHGLLRILEIVLAITAVGTGATAVILRIRANS
ncbi:MAG: hypothetical protein PHQ40_18250, partial [Anaerolineaceae bacterium]|nr:hypothetical protein [Anaerolineaceae bacterium]